MSTCFTGSGPPSKNVDGLDFVKSMKSFIITTSPGVYFSLHDPTAAVEYIYFTPNCFNAIILAL